LSRIRGFKKAAKKLIKKSLQSIAIAEPDIIMALAWD
jgi:hypothetical protein